LAIKIRVFLYYNLGVKILSRQCKYQTKKALIATNTVGRPSNPPIIKV
jgi:hypothetical protein